jgi:type II secretory pathway component PulJ
MALNTRLVALVLFSLLSVNTYVVRVLVAVQHNQRR